MDPQILSSYFSIDVTLLLSGVVHTAIFRLSFFAEFTFVFVQQNKVTTLDNAIFLIIKYFLKFEFLLHLLFRENRI